MTAAEVADPPASTTSETGVGFATRVAVLSTLGFGLAWAALLALAWAGLYGAPENVLHVRLFQHWANEILVLGGVPYLDFGIEYPPLGIATFLVPMLVTGVDPSVAEYRTAFQVEMLAFGLVATYATVQAAAALDGSRRDLLLTGAVAAAAPLLMGPLIAGRFDVVPMALSALALWSVLAGRQNFGAVFIALGALVKLYPLFLAPFIAAYVWRHLGSRAAAQWCLIVLFVLVLGFGPFWVLAGDDVTGMLLRTLERPLQIEALGASLLVLANAVAGMPIEVVHSFDSWNLAGPTPDAIAAGQTLLSVPVLAALFFRFGLGRAGPAALALVAAAALTVYVGLGKAFSPQYMLWLFPLVALLPAALPTRPWGLAVIGLLTAATLLTSIYYPANYWPYVNGRELGWTLVVVGRNVLVMALVALLVVATWRATRGRGEAPATS